MKQWRTVFFVALVLLLFGAECNRIAGTQAGINASLSGAIVAAVGLCMTDRRVPRA